MNIESDPPEHPVISISPLTKTDMFHKRVYSALVLLPLAIIPTVWGGVWFQVLIMAAALLMLREWHAITQGRPSRGLLRLEAGLVLVAAILMAVGDWPFALGLLAVGAVLAHVIGGAVIRPLPWPGLGVLYVGLPVLALIWMRGQDQGLYWVLWVFLVVWCTDILAYAFGRTLGGPKLAPRFSPRKTWVGLAGGMLGGSGASLAVGIMAEEPFHLALFVIWGCVGAVIAQIGDIAESMLKRTFNVKDSGRLIPGHGGILDRVDGMITTSVLLWIILALVPVWEAWV